MAYITYIEKFKKGNDEYNIKAASAETAIVADRAITADTVDSIGNVRKYSGFYDGKQREGLQIINNSGEGSEALIELNDKGNFALESKTKHLNLESAKGIQVKPTTTLTLDSTRRIIAGKGNEIQVEARFDDFGDVSGYTGTDEEWAELKINSRNLDLRCHEHGGIALQIAGKDKNGNENKIKFESDRTNSISEEGTYNGEGGKGLEFGTFNNLHSSLYTGDYRFRGKGLVYGVTRDAPVPQGDKTDYITQTGSSLVNDFKDPINESTPRATWNQIIDAANKCNGKEEIASIQDVAGMIAEASIPDYTGTTEHLATQEYVQNYVNEHGGGSSYEAGNGIHIEDNTISVNNYSSIEPLTALTDNVVALNDIKIGKNKGNFTVDVTGEYTWEQTAPKSATTIDEYENVLYPGERVVLHTNEAFYEDTNKVYYKAGVNTTLADGETIAPKGTIVYRPGYTISFDDVPSEGEDSYAYYLMGDNEESYYENPANSYYKCKAKSGATYFNGNEAHKDDTVSFAGLTQEEIEYYDSLGAQYDEDGNEIVKAVWEKVDIWKKCPLWTVNEININLETDSKIKFAGNKIETVWTVDGVDKKMSEISLSTESLVGDITTVEFEKKISKNGDRSGQDTEIVYSYTNNVSDPTKVANFAAFKANYNKKHTPKTDEELQLMYDEFLAEGTSYEVRVTISELLGLVARVRELEDKVAALENQLSGE